ncbi:class I SAM-dependent methyltransferase [Arundinibacter roseus]|uniref:SAM-dependent methyltransferase n=1 Tax=Arundinibacter roseus TaxID=2070510 RepID=A0A4R4K7H1_9BACT|nr:SAM-dependent methyltransferase [Arundinibacter roseus]TDB63440.1 SAM-dependent methyltransferase [Arundinibacter roseus]
MTAEITRDFISHVQESLANGLFIKANFGDYKGPEEELKSLYIKKIVVKKQEKLSFLYRYKRKDVTKNYSPEEALLLLQTLLTVNGFRFGHLFTLHQDVVVQYSKGRFGLRHEKPSVTELPSLEHDKQKPRKIEAQGKSYLYQLGLTDAQGTVYKQGQDKYRQINHYIEILSNLLQNLPARPLTTIVDMGAGKGYLTFALYDYLTHTLLKNTQVTGVEFRKELVGFCNSVAVESGFSGLKFAEGTIENYVSPEQIHVLIALHACDTATDEAIFQGIRADADLIVVAPCCHKQIRREMEKHRASSDLDFLTKHGIFLERQAEMVTDGIRSLILEYYGYSTRVMEFISDAHTPKNVLIVGEKRRGTSPDREAIRRKIDASKHFFGIGYHHLERLLGLV